MPKYLVTGGCGFIGSHLVKGLIQNGHFVRILDDLSNGDPSRISNKAELIIGSVTDEATLEKALVHMDGCFHLAAIPSVPKSIEKWRETSKVNLGGTICLFEAISRMNKKIPVIYASSAAVYGNSAEFPLNENLPCFPLSPYGADKAAAEMQARLAWNIFGIPNKGFRFFNVYGEGQDPHSPYSGVISLFSELISQGCSVTILGDGEQKRDFVYVGDVVRILMFAMGQIKKGAEIFNLCSGDATTINKLADLIGEVMGLAVDKKYLPSRVGDIKVSLGNPSKLKEAYNLIPRTSLREGLTELMRNKMP